MIYQHNIVRDVPLFLFGMDHELPCVVPHDLSGSYEVVPHDLTVQWVVLSVKILISPPDKAPWTSPLRHLPRTPPPK